MALLQDIAAGLASVPGEIREKKGVFELSFVVAERKTFLSRRKLKYTARFRIDEEKKTVRFTEMLAESGYGLSAGDTSPGMGFKKETYNTSRKERKGTIEEQSRLFGKKYEYNFDYGAIREKIKEIARAAGYDFDYKITSVAP
jgi:predicted secreted acid phosphatase